MHAFGELYDRLDRTNATNDKVAAIVDYLGQAPAVDAAWATYFLAGERLRQPVKVRAMTTWALELCGIDQETFDVCYEEVGDRAETLALLLEAMPDRTVDDPWDPPLHEAVASVAGLRAMSESEQRAALQSVWPRLGLRELFVYNKLITGAFRVGVSKRLLVRALSQWSGLDRSVLFHRLMGAPVTTAEQFRALLDPETGEADRAKPYPFFLASPLEADPAGLGAAGEWVAEWKWDGIRGQMIQRDGAVSIWSRGEELVTDQFPDLRVYGDKLPSGTVLDGEILAWRDHRPMPFASLQKRLGRKRVGKKTLADVPCSFVCYDLLEVDGEDIRERPLAMRLRRLAEVAASAGLPVSEQIEFAAWPELVTLRATSRSRAVEGLMLKRAASPYRTGRVRGDWWKWKVAPLELDAVLIYAQPGHGRRAGLHTDYTFAVWRDDELVPVAKAYSGLANEEIRKLDAWIRRHTTDKFGPVRQVEPQHVFELHFDDAQRSTRHKSGVALRFPRIARWRQDKQPRDASTLGDVFALIDGEVCG
ncbi:MAG: ATP-dependent DNA ligase [Planctomycetota bacterium]